MHALSHAKAAAVGVAGWWFVAVSRPLAADVPSFRSYRDVLIFTLADCSRQNIDNEPLLMPFLEPHRKKG